MVGGPCDDPDHGAPEPAVVEAAPGQAAAADPDRLVLDDEPAGPVEARQGGRRGELLGGPGAGQDPAIGRRHHGRTVEQPDELLAEVGEVPAGEDDVDQRPVHLVGPREQLGLLP